MLKLLHKLLEKAKYSDAYRFLLNFLLFRIIPFNKPHRLRILSISDFQVRVAIPFIRRNKNHIGGIHACCMATAAEFASGILLLSKINPAKYRIIMKSIHIDYHYQGRLPAIAKFELADDALSEIAEEEKTLLDFVVPVFDSAENLLCEAKVTWQVKSWQHVQTK